MLKEKEKRECTLIIRINRFVSVVILSDVLCSPGMIFDRHCFTKKHKTHTRTKRKKRIL